MLIINKNIIKFNSVQYKMINSDKLIIEKTIKEYTKFNFYEVDYEEEYKEYSNSDITLREYNNYIILEYQFDDHDIEKIKI